MAPLILAAALAIGLGACSGGYAPAQTSGEGHPVQPTTAPPGTGPAAHGATTPRPTVPASPSASSGETGWFGGYVDVTVKPPYSFEAATAPGRPVLSFVIADPDNPCEPSWGGQYTLDKAVTDLNLDQRVGSLRQKGHGLAISFGGAAGDELARACKDPQALAQAYRKVIDRYTPDVIDFDIEADNLTDIEATARRSEALRQVFAAEGAAHMPRVWLTVPSTAQGLTAEGSAVVLQTLRDGVALAGVNIMTMDYDGPASGQQMLDTSLRAATSAHTQLAQLFGLGQGQDAAAWSKLGLTPMIGANDTPGETFDLQAAHGLNAFARSHGIGRLSMWSLNRDQPCPAGEAARKTDSSGDSEASDTCSGTSQATGAFTKTLSTGLEHPGTPRP
ncbi:chitinase [Sinomonas atrocyanea]|uniref:chitinase n=1 Tax=Sinomonas atrocyanea TaxID=37927 RepID=UPI0027895AC8|nr:chitinase [Sinomonas atrocyanea]MDQ0261919.1 chitinase [Sinomonas atrocyanea]MDR6623685.1 chitinase [Sinomonas atrocyanea]